MDISATSGRIFLVQGAGLRSRPLKHGHPGRAFVTARETGPVSESDIGLSYPDMTQAYRGAPFSLHGNGETLRPAMPVPVQLHKTPSGLAWLTTLQCLANQIAA
ncbi:hypothetical protein [Marinobacter guineae]|uniref:hypothetical protein n=1 Tax=Marinobacter guineae TaxID=432303 RepID=UPI001D17D241|nr:hypothetical protein [Marinobacter guineae]